MVANVGQNTNTNDVASLTSGISVNNSTSTTLLTTTADTIRVVISNEGNQDTFIKFQAASVDNDKKGFILHKGVTTDVLTAPNMYVGELSAINATGNTTIYVTSF